MLATSLYFIIKIGYGHLKKTTNKTSGQKEEKQKQELMVSHLPLSLASSTSIPLPS